MSRVKKQKKKIVLVGGGRGVARIARFMYPYLDNISLTTIHSVFDSGGHAGKMSRIRRKISVGDLRRGVTSTCDERTSRILEKRIADISLGNLFIQYCIDKCGSVEKGLRFACEAVGSKATVLPISLDRGKLRGMTTVGKKLDDIHGEMHFDDHRGLFIITALLTTPIPKLFEGAARAIMEADIVVFCPGSFYSSIVVNTMVDGFNEVVHAAIEKGVKVVMVTNLMNKGNETGSFTSSTFVEALCAKLGVDQIYAAIMNTGKVDEVVQEQYKKERSEPVKYQVTPFAKFSIPGNFISYDKGTIHRNETHVFHNERAVLEILTL